ncbi:MAG: L-threonylcarbamoyladenylate synthase [Roseburia sp.]|nr:L-threonylcarbamoyladenylate synthase [Roseburia sp.]
MKIIKTWTDSPSQKQIQEIISYLENSEIGIIPTDSIYALCCDALNAKAIDKLCKIKHINPDKTNLSIICADISMAAKYARIDNKNFSLLKKYTPGPVTFLFPALSSLPKAFKRRKVIGIRIPDVELTRCLASNLSHPLLVSTIDGKDNDYIMNPELIAESYQDCVAFVADAGEGGVTPSTILNCCEYPPKLVREGNINISEI